MIEHSEDVEEDKQRLSLSLLSKCQLLVLTFSRLEIFVYG